MYLKIDHIQVGFLKSICGGTSKIWAGLYNGTAKELSLVGHTHSGLLTIDTLFNNTTTLNASYIRYMVNGGGLHRGYNIIIQRV